MKYIWYQFILKNWLRIALFFFFKKIKVAGKENIPINGPIIFLSNHQNAFLDALLIITSQNRLVHSLVRASIFGNRFFNTLLNSINLIPIYRIRDGRKAMTKNDITFNRCFDLLKAKKSLLIFPEGNHNLKKQVRHISKGFTRIAFGALKEQPNLNLSIVTVAINYSEASSYFSKVSIHFSKPILVKEYIDHTKDLVAKVESDLKENVVHIDESLNYEDTYEKLVHLDADFSDVTSTTSLLKSLNRQSLKEPEKKKKTYYSVLLCMLYTNNILLLAAWYWIKPKIQDLAFYGSIKFSIGLIIIPLSYSIQTLIISYLFNGSIGGIYLIVSILSLPLLGNKRH